MPAKSEKQAKFMRACAHDWKPKGGKVKCPKKKVARKFMHTEDARRDWAIAAARADAREILKKERKYLDSEKGIKILEDLSNKLYAKYTPYGLTDTDAQRIVKGAASHIAQIRRNREDEGIVGSARRHAQQSGMNRSSQELFGGTGVATVASVLGKPIRKLTRAGEYSRRGRTFRDSVQMPTFSKFVAEGLKADLLLLKALEALDQIEGQLTDRAKPEEPEVSYQVPLPFTKDNNTSFSNKLDSYLNR